jgi:serine phosphatase RsbU (regulator of sigma subunit)/anti-sigma regulatory factor (Ser/Thr protein kinase)/putative methionine-R-sulfoxide reductase with GAF domain
VTLPPAEASVGAARGLVEDALAGWAADDVTDDATLLVSELATNAVVHAGTDFEVSAELVGDAVEVSVTDRHPTRTLPPPPESVDTDLESGRGLFLTAALAEKWGVDYTSTTKRVWFRLPLAGGAVPSPRTAAPADDAAEDGGPVAGVGSVRLDADGVVHWADATAAALLGRPLDELVGRTWLTLCDPAEAASVVAASAATRWQGSYPVVLPGGEVRRLQVRHVRLASGTGGRPGSALVVVDHRLRALIADVPSAATVGPPATTAPAGPFAHSPEALVRLELGELLDRTVAWARDLLGGDGAYALLVSGDDDVLELRAATGLRPDVERVPRRAGEGISGRVSRDLMPVVHDDLADVLGGPAGSRSAEPWLLAAGVRSLVAVPVLAEGRLIGTVGVTAARPSAFAVADGATLQRGVDAVALALQSARVTEIERRRHGWLGYLAEAGELLAGTLEPDMALALVAQLVTPRLGPWCAIYLVDESGRSARATEWHADEDRLDPLREYLDAVPAPEPPAAGVARWLPGSLDGSIGPAAATLADSGGHVAALVARGRALGTLVLGHDAGGGEGRRQELHLLADVAPRAALALDNARLYAERTATSRALQRSLLPPELPVLPGVDVGVVYEASGEGNEVGGDFYDVFPLGDQPAAQPGDAGAPWFAFAVGDVCGKGPEAAAVTGLARHALRLLSRRGDDIPAVLGHLNAAVLAEGPRARFVTLVYGEARRRPDGGLALRLASAGHPSPVLVRADGTASAAVASGGDLLGVFEHAATVVDDITLGPGDALVCFTDGVTERRDDGRMLGEEGVLAALTGAAGLDAAGLARRLEQAVSSFTTAPARDDVAILVIRPRPRAG